MNYLNYLEAEAIYIIREVISEFERPVLMYSIGKDSSVLLHLLKKAIYPSKMNIPLLHIDTLWKFKEMIEFRNEISKEFNLIVYSNNDYGKITNPFVNPKSHTDYMKTVALKTALDKYGFDAIIGGARRDEEKSRSKERIFSLREKNHVWNPKKQRPELWNLYNTNINKNETIRVFPLSNWSELDIWRYIEREKIEIVSLYFAKKRRIAKYNDIKILIDDKRVPKEIISKSHFQTVRFRTLGCYPLTGAIESTATKVADIIKEVSLLNSDERDDRVIDKDEKFSMEKRKTNGYF